MSGKTDASQDDHRKGTGAAAPCIFELGDLSFLEATILRTLIDSVPEHIYARDRAHRHILNNHTQLKLLGVKTSEETFGKTDFDFYPPEMAAKFHADNERVMATGKPIIDAEALIPGREGPRWISTTKVPLRDAQGNIVGLLGIGHDVTAVKQTMEKISEQAGIIDQAHDAIVLIDLENRVTYANAAAENLFGVKFAEVSGKTYHDIFPPDDREQFRVAYAETLAKGSWHGEYHLHHRTGREVFAEARRSLFLGPIGEPKAQLSISVDVTEKRHADALALRNQRLESLGTLAGGIAHDLNNILAPILMSIALLRHKVPDEGGQRLLGMLEKNAERGAQLVRQVLAFGRGGEGERSLVQLKHVAREIEHIVRNTFPKSIRFDFVCDPAPWAIIGDATQLHQVLLNLSVNARDAMPGGGLLTLKLENKLLDETFASMNPGSKPGPYLAVSVTDTGSGMSAKVKEHLFEPYFTTKDLGKGTGLGLSTSLGIVQSHGGFIHVASEVGKGTTFTLYLPATMERATPVTTLESSMGLPRGHNELVLVVDDEEPILSVAKSTLERFGYRVLVADNGATAVSLFALHRDSIAAVVTDISMPIMDGPAMAVALRAISPKVKIIGSSGLGSATLQAPVDRSEFFDFVPKPYTAEELLKAIARAVAPESTEDPDAGPTVA